MNTLPLHAIGVDPNLPDAESVMASLLYVATLYIKNPATIWRGKHCSWPKRSRCLSMRNQTSSAGFRAGCACNGHYWSTNMRNSPPSPTI